MGTDIAPVPVAGFAENFSAMARMAPPPLGSVGVGTSTGVGPWAAEPRAAGSPGAAFACCPGAVRGSAPGRVPLPVIPGRPGGRASPEPLPGQPPPGPGPGRCPAPGRHPSLEPKPAIAPSPKLVPCCVLASPASNKNPSTGPALGSEGSLRPRRAQPIHHPRNRSRLNVCPSINGVQLLPPRRFRDSIAVRPCQAANDAAPDPMRPA